MLAGSLAFYTIRSWARASDAAQAAGAINDMIELGEIEQAAGFVEKLRKADAGLLSYPPMIEACQSSRRSRIRKLTGSSSSTRRFARPSRRRSTSSIRPSWKPPGNWQDKKPRSRPSTQVVQRRASALAAERAKCRKRVRPPPRRGRPKDRARSSKRSGEAAPERLMSRASGAADEARRELAELATGTSLRRRESAEPGDRPLAKESMRQMPCSNSGGSRHSSKRTSPTPSRIRSRVERANGEIRRHPR